MMRFLYAWLLAGCFFFSTLFAQTETEVLETIEEAVDAVLVETQENDLGPERLDALLWQVTHPDVDGVSYLHGTMHTDDKRVHALNDTVFELMDACDGMALEIVMDERSFSPFKLLDMIFMDGDTTLKDLYTDEEFKLVKQYSKEKMGMMALIFDIKKMKPLFVSIFAEQMKDFDPGKLGQPDDSKATSFLDLSFQEWGQDHDKVMVSIESVEEQMGAFDAIPLKEQAAMLLMQVKNETGEDAETQMEELIQLYLAQDLDSMYAFSMYEQYDTSYSQLSGSMDQFSEMLVVKRNYNMAHRMDSVMQLRPMYLAVGALHLPGPEGVIPLLRKRGYTLLPVKGIYEE